MRTHVLPQRERCTGCGACVSVCKKSAIRMQMDAEGFLYPLVDSALCIGCDQCEKRCPANQQQQRNEPKAFSVQNKNIQERLASSSGGVFSALARETLRRGGVVFGAVFDPDFRVEHVGAITEQEFCAMRGSKYVQSDAAESLSHAVSLIQKEVPVLFSGTPCQVAGLYALLGGKRPENLISVDFICHGVPSPAVFHSYLESLKQSYGGPVESYSFRDKRKGWRDFSAAARFQNGSFYAGTQKEDPFLIGFLANLYLRPSCHQCTGLRMGNHVSDLTLADLWGAEKVLSEKDDDSGLSLVFANTDRGISLLSSLREVESHPIEDVGPLSTANPSILVPAPAHENRERFFRLFKKRGFRSGDVLRLTKPERSLIIRGMRKLRRVFGLNT